MVSFWAALGRSFWKAMGFNCAEAKKALEVCRYFECSGFRGFRGWCDIEISKYQNTKIDIKDFCISILYLDFPIVRPLLAMWMKQ